MNGQFYSISLHSYIHVNNTSIGLFCARLHLCSGLLPLIHWGNNDVQEPILHTKHRVRDITMWVLPTMCRWGRQFVSVSSVFPFCSFQIVTSCGHLVLKTMVGSGVKTAVLLCDHVSERNETEDDDDWLIDWLTTDDDDWLINWLIDWVYSTGVSGLN